jgi:hypothetical protein
MCNKRYLLHWYHLEFEEMQLCYFVCNKHYFSEVHIFSSAFICVC